MKPWIRHTGLGLAVLIGVGVAALFVASRLGERKMQRQVDIAASAVALRDDEPGIERGRYLFRTRGCAECHGDDGAGKDVMNDGKGLHIHAPNITSGAGGVTARYSATDWTRTIRHGVKADGRPS